MDKTVGGSGTKSKVASSAALDNFMRFDKKYKDAVQQHQKDVDTDTDISDVVTTTAAAAASPTRIASELEEKLAPNSSRRASLARKNSAVKFEAVQVESRLKQLASDRNLKLDMAAGEREGNLRRSRKVSESTTAEVSEQFVSPTPSPPVAPLSALSHGGRDGQVAASPTRLYSPRSPMSGFVREEALHDIEELDEEHAASPPDPHLRPVTSNSNKRFH